MWRRKKWITIIVMAVTLVLVAGITVGVAFAQTGTAQTDPTKTLLARVATILGIDQSKVEAAFTQAQKEMQAEALANHLKSLVDQGTITQQQADQYQQWWQSKPNTPALDSRGGPGLPGGFRGMPGPRGLPPLPPPTTPKSS